MTQLGGEGLISIHALARSATTVRNAVFTGLQNFNPRTREECDLLREMLRLFRQDFNPRTREECDDYNHPDILSSLLFQSTHSRGVRRP